MNENWLIFIKFNWVFSIIQHRLFIEIIIKLLLRYPFGLLASLVFIILLIVNKLISNHWLRGIEVLLVEILSAKVLILKSIQLYILNRLLIRAKIWRRCDEIMSLLCMSKSQLILGLAYCMTLFLILWVHNLAFAFLLVCILKLLLVYLIVYILVRYLISLYWCILPIFVYLF